ncbi:PREDICTED: uncharacterized protein LOC109129566 [Camelina sativa]|uniref:Uncharacterized protein LOC109129566 n=1 Tax=Camelina sativa TaxID=90675 RepID=A0ABM1R372_CAMSA|nr:PREDICTED: uncharacterized protein LOC109129566 [Camelina sativa]
MGSAGGGATGGGEEEPGAGESSRRAKFGPLVRRREDKRRGAAARDGKIRRDEDEDAIGWKRRHKQQLPRSGAQPSAAGDEWYSEGLCYGNNMAKEPFTIQQAKGMLSSKEPQPSRSQRESEIGKKK